MRRFSFFYSGQTRRTRLDLTQFYEKKGSAENRPGIPGEEEYSYDKKCHGRRGGYKIISFSARTTSKPRFAARQCTQSVSAAFLDEWEIFLFANEELTSDRYFPEHFHSLSLTIVLRGRRFSRKSVRVSVEIKINVIRSRR